MSGQDIKRAYFDARYAFKAASHANNAVYMKHRANGWKLTDKVPKDLQETRAALAQATADLDALHAQYYGTPRGAA